MKELIRDANSLTELKREFGIKGPSAAADVRRGGTTMGSPTRSASRETEGPARASGQFGSHKAHFNLEVLADASRQQTTHPGPRARPRVQITYDVETNGAMRKVELPFVIGVLADLSGMPKEALKPLKERKFVPIDRDNFNKVLAKMEPRFALRVQNRLTDENSKLGSRADLQAHRRLRAGPRRRAGSPALKELLDMHHKLTQMLSKMEGNEKLEKLLEQALNNTDQKMALARETRRRLRRRSLENRSQTRGDEMSTAPQQTLQRCWRMMLG